ncbi:MAG: hypothetical protein WCA21_00740 [Terracidiphilus sp.]|jgi:hypothetical protein
MATAAVGAPRNEQQPGLTAEPSRRRRRGHEEDQQARYFLAKEGSSPEKPELGAEAANEGEALIRAFQTKSGLLYSVVVYKAEAEIQNGSPTLVKRPVRK